MLVSGNKGYGKSAFVKAYLHRQAMAGKWMAILDPKGEYLDLGQAGSAVGPGPAPGWLRAAQPSRGRAGRRGLGRGLDVEDDIRGRRIGVVIALAESATGRPVTSDERSVVTAALMELERRVNAGAPGLERRAPPTDRRCAT